jgi:6,7-dimethyl-8-ribityllumazine synthase
MATRLKNLSEFDTNAIPDGSKYRIGIVVSRWNAEITGALLKGASDTLKEHGVKEKNITITYVPGTFELPLGAQYLAQQDKMNAVIALGCVIQGETRHFDFICDAAANGIMQVGLTHNKPVIFGVLTTDNQKQAQDRAGGKHGNKGVEAAVTALQMIALTNGK